ncbi:NAD(P)-binding domain-containing protein, partial [Salmonella enterica]|uniref:NAD(P)-binding domain-containing protein n=1 Tax=Salmonella enterica TaxID=28901 RepID=UPI003D2E6A2F
PVAAVRDAFTSAGGKAMASAAEAVAGARVVITMLPTGKVVRDVLLGEKGIARGLPKGTIIIDMSSSAPTDTTGLAADLEPLGLVLLGAP